MSLTRTRVAKGGVLVLGGGFAGSYVARELGRSGATIVNPTNFMLYTPLLPEAAAGSIEPRHVTVPLRAMAPESDLVLGSAVALDPERRLVEVESEAGRFAIAYADLVVALGAVTRMPDLPGLHEHAFRLKDLGDAIGLRNHVRRQIELADAAPEQGARRLTFVFAGAGFAGVEVLAELRELVAETLPRHPRLAHVEPRWLLLDGGVRILGQRCPSSSLGSRTRP
jgi:NADH:ubiquinone reductase (H+-translocating)